MIFRAKEGVIRGVIQSVREGIKRCTRRCTRVFNKRCKRCNKKLIAVREGVILFTNPSTQAGYDTRSIFKRSLTGFNSEFSFSKTSCLTKAEEPSLSYCLPRAGGRIIGFIHFPRVLLLCEM